MSEMWKRVNTPSGVGFQVIPSRTAWPSSDFFPLGGPDALGDQVLDPEALAAAPDAGGGVEGHRFLVGLAVCRLPSVRGWRRSSPALFLISTSFSFQTIALAQAVTGLVFEEQDVVLGGEDAGAAM